MNHITRWDTHTTMSAHTHIHIHTHTQRSKQANMHACVRSPARSCMRAHHTTRHQRTALRVVYAQTCTPVAHVFFTLLSLFVLPFLSSLLPSFLPSFLPS